MKKHIAVFLLTMFTLFLVAPTIISALDRNADVSAFFNLNEEENNNMNEVVKKFKFEVFSFDKFLDITTTKKKSKVYDFYLQNYSPLSLECASPPPEV